MTGMMRPQYINVFSPNTIIGHSFTHEELETGSIWIRAITDTNATALDCQLAPRPLDVDQRLRESNAALRQECIGGGSVNYLRVHIHSRRELIAGLQSTRSVTLFACMAGCGSVTTLA
jgi:hypothetical protein